MCVCDIVPDEGESALSIPQQYYISTITGWTDTKLEPAVQQVMRDRYRRALPVSCGTYIADYDTTCEDANVSHTSANQAQVVGNHELFELKSGPGKTNVRCCTFQIP